MPRKATKADEEETKRAPRRQVPRKRTSSRTRRIVKAEEKKESTPKVERRMETEETGPERKAPTKISQTKKTWRPSKRLLITGSVLVSGLIATLWIGFSDQGQIDISAKIVERNNEIMAGVDDGENSAAIAKSQMVPVQNTKPTVPNGGLRGRGVGTSKASQPNVPVATSTATSTASSTLDVASSTQSSVKETEGLGEGSEDDSEEVDNSEDEEVGGEELNEGDGAEGGL